MMNNLFHICWRHNSAHDRGKNHTNLCGFVSWCHCSFILGWHLGYVVLMRRKVNIWWPVVGRRWQGVAPQNSISMAGIPIPQVKTHKDLGVIFNDTLIWSNHIDEVYGYERCAQRVGILRRLRSAFPSCALCRIYVGSVLPIRSTAERRRHTAWCNEIGPLTSLIHVTQVHPVTTEDQFHCTRLYRFPSDHGVSTSMGDHQGTPRAVGSTWCIRHMAKPRPRVGWMC